MVESQTVETQQEVQTEVQTQTKQEVARKPFTIRDWSVDIHEAGHQTMQRQSP